MRSKLSDPTSYGTKSAYAYMTDQRRAWQEDIRALFGSITDETFQRQPELPFSLDAKREEFLPVRLMPQRSTKDTG